ncbi:MAG TPA: response regulator [Terriglobia bacterium]|nr:response regulator [Terriglobia bacterium]
MASVPRNNKKILVVEDDPGILKVVSLALTKGGLDVITASDGEAALQVVQKEEPHAILLDINLPKMDGLTLCKKLKEDWRTAAIPVGFVSAQVETAYYKEAKKMGGLLFLPKPFNPDKLLNFVQLLLASRKEIE